MRRPMKLMVLSTVSALAFACETTPANDTGVGDTEGGRDAPRPTDVPGLDAPMTADTPVLDAPADAPPPSGTPLVVAVGHMGRTIVSCDDGRTWRADTSLDDTRRCWLPDDTDPRYVECDHHPGSSKGIVYGRDRFFTSSGWGMPGRVQRTDGSTWEDVVTGTTFGDVAYGNGVLLLAARNFRRSDDDGATLSEPRDSGLAVYNVRRAGYGEGVFVMAGSDGMDNDVVISPDATTWTHPDTLPDACGGAIQTEGGIVAGNGVLLVLGGNGVACTSTDSGRTFTQHAVGMNVDSHLVFDGTSFVAFTGGMRLTSTDGATWTSTAISPGSVRIGALARTETGALIGVRGGWQVWYDRQEMYRSEDGGLTWETIAGFPGGHPIRAIEAGRGTCPP